MRISDWSSDVCSSDLTGRREVDERSLRTEVIIPYVLFHRLEPPDRFTCGHVQRNKRSCIEVFGWTPQTAVIVSSGIAHRQVDISKLLISRSDSPHIRCAPRPRSEEHTSELQSLMRISYAVFCLKKKKNIK